MGTGVRVSDPFNRDSNAFCGPAIGSCICDFLPSSLRDSLVTLEIRLPTLKRGPTTFAPVGALPGHYLCSFQKSLPNRRPAQLRIEFNCNVTDFTLHVGALGFAELKLEGHLAAFADDCDADHVAGLVPVHHRAYVT